MLLQACAAVALPSASGCWCRLQALEMNATRIPISEESGETSAATAPSRVLLEDVNIVQF